jgi:HD-like signal output (HDOD) protein
MPMTAQPTDAPRESSLQLVLRRLSNCSGFPTLSTTISDINRVVETESHSAQQITQVILRDVSLTTTLLQVVNSATYGQYRGSIRTISKAVLILGTEAVRNAAMTLMVLAFSKGRTQEKSLQDELIGAFFAGVVAKNLCQRIGMPKSEEAVIATMCHSLGRLLVVFFLYEESQQIRALVKDGLSEEQAAVQVLGITYRDLGIGVARHWNFPDKLIEGMQSLKARDIAPPANDAERLKIAANLANDLYAAALRSSQADKEAALQALSQRYGAALKLDAKALIEALRQGLAEIAERSAALNLAVAHSPALNAVRSWAGQPAEAASAAPADDTATHLIKQVNTVEEIESKRASTANVQQVLSAGIRDITETLTGDFSLNDVLHMALETMYRGMGFSRTMIFIRDPRTASMRARFGFGTGIEKLIPQCSFPLAFEPDVFHVSLEKGLDIVIENTQAENVVQRIPLWHRQILNARSFLLLPVVLKNQPAGLLYADSDRGDGIRINSEQLDLLRTLRTQVVLAFRTSGSTSR